MCKNRIEDGSAKNELGVFHASCYFAVVSGSGDEVTAVEVGMS